MDRKAPDPPLILNLEALAYKPIKIYIYICARAAAVEFKMVLNYFFV
jgi:hypothetical protein